ASAKSWEMSTSLGRDRMMAELLARKTASRPSAQSPAKSGCAAGSSCQRSRKARNSTEFGRRRYSSFKYRSVRLRAPSVALALTFSSTIACSYASSVASDGTAASRERKAGRTIVWLVFGPPLTDPSTISPEDGVQAKLFDDMADQGISA